MNVLLMCEGNWDGRIGARESCEGAALVILRRIISGNLGRELNADEIRVSRLPKLTKGGGLKRKMELAISETDSSSKHDSLVVIVDRDCEEFKDRLKEMRTGVDQMAGKKLAARTVAAMAVEELEAWLLADHNLLTTVLKAPKGISAPEEEQDPKAILHDLFAKAGIERTSGYDIVAKRLDPAVVESKCKAFKLFAAEVRQKIT